MSKQSNQNLVIAIIVSSLLLSASIIFLGVQLSGKTPDNDQYKKYRKSVEADLTHNDAVMGDANAPVTMIEYSDYQCPFCRKYFQESYSKIKANYVDKGLVKIIFKDYPLPGHSDAFKVANAAECVRKQTNDQAYFAFHDAVFTAQGDFTLGTVPVETDTLLSIGEELGIDTVAYEKCINDNEFEEEIIADIFAAEKSNVEATPTFIINGTYVEGAYPYERFAEVIDGLLADINAQNN